MEQQNANRPSVAVVGAGVSGLVAAKYLRDANLNVTVFERASRLGGLWVFDERLPPEPSYPNVTPSSAETTPRPSNGAQSIATMQSQHAPAGPAYVSLKNNIPTCLMSFRDQRWPPGTPDYTSRTKVLEYIHSFVQTQDLEHLIEFDTRVSRVAKDDKGGWSVETRSLDVSAVQGPRQLTHNHHFDAVVVCSGHHSAQKIPDIPGLPELKQKWPPHIWHLKAYRRSQDILGDNIVLVGNGASAYDIAHELKNRVKKLYQVNKVGSGYIPAQVMPEVLKRVAEIESVEDASESHGDNSDKTNGASSPSLNYETSKPSMRLRLIDGQVLEGIHSIILCTGYIPSYPFISQYHDDHATKAEGGVIITDGSMHHNLHKDIFFIPEPTLAFVGVPIGVTSLALFEYQALAIADFLTGRIQMPSENEMRAEYQLRLEKKGPGRKFHSLMSEEVEYVEDILRWVNSNRKDPVPGYSQEWLDTYAKRQAFIREVYMKQMASGGKPSGRDVLGICTADSPSYLES